MARVPVEDAGLLSLRLPFEEDVGLVGEAHRLWTGASAVRWPSGGILRRQSDFLALLCQLFL
jgi:hypothetical protein